ncbi:glycosyl transferase family 2 [Collibacillus ludicampi]|jgi:glycosyltransferase involved in cell wall biosynthesis|uniref:Glycosyl transferase family 2 n=1 Tax=Collibacillus ludicampi TaxID=2771369 RepID=A0AAV4LCN0_9BACL|nr:glycosyltransferase family 2 protein [Collibacillus ludicampi]GIM45592.1 glycosyl transferase family 2 [Collibacillus ludicampi]
MSKKVLVIIPAYNEEKSVGHVIQKIRRAVPSVDVLVVNDGSTDATSQVARQAGAQVVDLPFNLGIGGGMQTGYLYAYRNGYDAAVQIDADGQHDPADLPRLLTHLEKGEADLILGSRYVEKTRYRSTWTRRIGMIILSKMVSLIIGKPVYDTTSGYRVVNRNVMRLFAQNYPTDYPEVEALVLVHLNGYKIREVPVEMEERKAGRSSITPLKSVYYMVKVGLALVMNVLRKPTITKT